MVHREPLRVFYSYSHKDSELLYELKAHLAILRKQGLIQDWYDRKILAGSEWEPEIIVHLESSNIIILLISADFIASDYCYGIEMERALAMHREGKARVIPIIVRKVDWTGASFGHLQALPTDAKPITLWSDRDEAWTDVTKGLRKVAENLTNNNESGPLNRSERVVSSIRPIAAIVSPSNGAPWLSGIEGDALPRFIVSREPVIRVIAGPGSGKTTGLKRRVQRLIMENGTSPGRILVGTFTRAIAEELRATLGVDVDYQANPSNDNIHVSTLHSLAYHLLRQYPSACPDRSLRFLLAFEEDVMLYDLGELLSDAGTQSNRKDRLNKTLAEWADGSDLTDDRFAGAMDRWLREHGGMLIGEVVKLAQRALERGDIPKGLFDHVVVDEYQDLTRAEQMLVELLWSREGSLTVLGDDDQSIYSFRHNFPRGITEFRSHWPTGSVQDIHLLENRRSQPSIVDFANRMMAEAGTLKPPMVPARHREADRLTFVYWPNLEAEVKGIAEYILRRDDEKFLVLVPRRFIGYRLRTAIGDDASTSFHQELLDSPLVRERMTAASLLADPDDRVALRAWFGFAGNRAEDADHRNACAYASLSAASLDCRTLVKMIANGEIIPRGRGGKHIQNRAHILVNLWQYEHLGFNELLDFLFDPSLADRILDQENRIRAQTSLELLRDAGREIGENFGTEELSTILSRIRYHIATRTPLRVEPRTRVQIMTLHSAKGLEADSVIIAGLADQVIPGHSPVDIAERQRQREKQRRLLYVSITRARDSLIVSWPKSMKYQDATANNIRIDRNAVSQHKGERLVRLNSCSLLPFTVGAIPGTQLK
ncbi:UvrD-helicase domain-containing protein [Nitrolancea hollandica]|uniref:DNA 3'-5' helicase n=1 Tax=Nitrolancea hollandica Lb TaxID=1129897 RepID=I4EKV5_9BACT|nr:UvrD-helicase domain-containing protein [Nitrolancea hollandica]CCF85317.1 hypothetical protein NITHO_4800003 [Nitrolancea hollandica Lb]